MAQSGTDGRNPARLGPAELNAAPTMRYYILETGESSRSSPGSRHPTQQNEGGRVEHWRRNGSDQGGGGTNDFSPHSFHATPIGLMLKFRIQGGTVPRSPPPVPPPAGRTRPVGVHPRSVRGRPVGVHPRSVRGRPVGVHPR